MTYRIVCTYHPDVGTFRGKRGAWRVRDCYEAQHVCPRAPVRVIDAGDGKILIINSLRPRQRHSWCNPRKILGEWLQVFRSDEEAAVVADVAYNAWLQSLIRPNYSVGLGGD